MVLMCSFLYPEQQNINSSQAGTFLAIGDTLLILRWQEFNYIPACMRILFIFELIISLTLRLLSGLSNPFAISLRNSSIWLFL
jgi:hypothetical protein